MRLFFVAAIVFLCLLEPLTQQGYAKIHSAPIIVHGFKVRHITRYPLDTYRVFKTGPKGEAIPIPFQIDELNDYGDYILDQGGDVTKNDGNGLFDAHDELSFMGDDVGPVKAPTKWRFEKPTLLYELKLQFRGNKAPLGNNVGAVYIGVYFNKAPPLSKKRYVSFKPKQGVVQTSRYLYEFDQKNYLVVKGVSMLNGKKQTPLLDSSTFYLKADLKYFLTFEVFHKDVQSYLEAYKVGPIRAIVRVTFFYRFLKINFELGMYTEVSLFSNSVVLPAIMYNPLDGSKNLNEGSGFYYGFAITENPATFKIESNIPEYNKPTSKLLNFFKQEPTVNPNYWLSVTGKDRMMYFEVSPSQEMLQNKNIPYLYQENKSAKEILSKRPNDDAKPLGESPVNMAIFFDLAKFKEGEHRISFRLYFDNRFDQREMNAYKSVDDWRVILRRL